MRLAKVESLRKVPPSQSTLLAPKRATSAHDLHPGAIRAGTSRAQTCLCTRLCPRAAKAVLDCSRDVVLQGAQMLQELEILSQSHEREVDMKDAIIQMLDRAIPS